MGSYLAPATPTVQGATSAYVQLPPARTGRTTARTAGALLITATAASLVSTALLNPVLNGSGYLAWTFAHQDRVIAGSLFLIVAAFAGAGIAIALYPTLRRYGQGLAIGSVSFRVMEAVMYLVSAVAVLLLVTLSQDVAAGSVNDAGTLGSLLRALHDQASLAGILAFYVGALLYYSIFFRSRLIPRWLSGWGIIGVVLGLGAGLLVLFKVTGSMSALQVGLNVPIGVNEMVLAVWLIIRGFSSPETHSPVPS